MLHTTNAIVDLIDPEYHCWPWSKAEHVENGKIRDE
jgi:hypothetical protein